MRSARVLPFVLWSLSAMAAPLAKRNNTQGYYEPADADEYGYHDNGAPAPSQPRAPAPSQHRAPAYQFVDPANYPSYYPDDPSESHPLQLGHVSPAPAFVNHYPRVRHVDLVVELHRILLSNDDPSNPTAGTWLSSETRDDVALRPENVNPLLETIAIAFRVRGRVGRDFGMYRYCVVYDANQMMWVPTRLPETGNGGMELGTIRVPATIPQFWEIWERLHNSLRTVNTNAENHLYQGSLLEWMRGNRDSIGLGPQSIGPITHIIQAYAPYRGAIQQGGGFGMALVGYNPEHHVNHRAT
ncbi:hypothetical protein EV361DRAFT_244118 [Lentinula raphanica]|nr:hypothetical protein F5880DRAFT_146198 [Lentinula raphanica]KAJ3971074.1 hypothetical protein EV361DRAFT_244118 [Lentinula raphanica]